MNVVGLLLTVPAIDWRPLLDTPAFPPFKLTNAVSGELYVPGIGLLLNRRSEFDHRPDQTLYFDCRGGISLPQGFGPLPQRHNHHRETPTVNVLRRIYSDGGVLVRLELGIFMNPTLFHARPRCIADAFWCSTVTFKGWGQEFIKLPLREAFPRLLRKFIEAAPKAYCRIDGSGHAIRHVSDGSYRALEPQLQVVGETTKEELAHFHPESISDEIFVEVREFNPTGYQTQVQLVCLRYLPIAKGLSVEETDEKAHLQKLARAHLAWAHADIEALEHMILRAPNTVNPAAFSQKVVELAKRLGMLPTSDRDRQMISNLMGRIRRKTAARRISRILEQLNLPNANSPLSDAAREEVKELLQAA